jgi:hypothetical protein
MSKQPMQNKHLEHPEDTILTGDLSVLDWFITAGDLSVKIDGAPAIVWGRNPANGEFFVGTKAVFNKVKIRIAHSHEEIDQFYQGEVATILHACYNHLPRTNLVYQGDFVGFGGGTEYRPNTITYQFPETIDQAIIVAPHTYYIAENDLRDAVAYPDCSVWVDTDTVKFVKPSAYILHNQESFADAHEVCQFAKQMATMVKFLNKKDAEHFKKCVNTFIKVGAVLDDFALSVAANCDINLVRLWKLVKSIKEDCLFICRNDGPAAYLGQDRIDAEGYVLVNKFGAYKLINREVFSRTNFNSGRFQCAA